jgi:hypothetical protein
MRRNQITLYSEIEDILKYISPKFGDIYLVSKDSHYFLTHQLILASTSDVLASLLSPREHFPREDDTREHYPREHYSREQGPREQGPRDQGPRESDTRKHHPSEHDPSEHGPREQYPREHHPIEHDLIILDQVSGNILKHFLSLIYTGESQGLKSNQEIQELKDLCKTLKLKHADSLTTVPYRTSIPNLTPGFKEVVMEQMIDADSSKESSIVTSKKNSIPKLTPGFNEVTLLPLSDSNERQNKMLKRKLKAKALVGLKEVDPLSDSNESSNKMIKRNSKPKHLHLTNREVDIELLSDSDYSDESLHIASKRKSKPKASFGIKEFGLEQLTDSIDRSNKTFKRKLKPKASFRIKKIGSKQLSDPNISSTKKSRPQNPSLLNKSVNIEELSEPDSFNVTSTITSNENNNNNNNNSNSNNNNNNNNKNNNINNNNNTSNDKSFPDLTFDSLLNDLDPTIQIPNSESLNPSLNQLKTEQDSSDNQTAKNSTNQISNSETFPELKIQQDYYTAEGFSNPILNSETLPQSRRSLPIQQDCFDNCKAEGFSNQISNSETLTHSRRQLNSDQVSLDNKITNERELLHLTQLDFPNEEDNDDDDDSTVEQSSLSETMEVSDEESIDETMDPLIKSETDNDNESVTDNLDVPKIPSKELYRKMKMKKENGRFFCLYNDCVSKERSFKFISGIRDHFILSHLSEDLKLYKCISCEKRFGTKGVRTHHQKRGCERRAQKETKKNSKHSGLQKKNKDGRLLVSDNKCTYEQRSIQNISDLIDHYMDPSTDNANEVGTNNQDSTNTMQKIPSKELFCDMKMKEENGRFFCLDIVCASKQRSFQFISGIRDHFILSHLSEDLKLFKCNKCNKRFGTRGLITQHKRKVCEKTKQKKTKKKSKYIGLQMEEKDGRFFCLDNDCASKQRSFQHIHGLRDHFMETHASQKEFKCSSCNKLFGTKGLHTKHQRKCKSTLMSKAQRLMKPEVITCEQCGKHSTTMHNHR